MRLIVPATVRCFPPGPSTRAVARSRKRVSSRNLALGTMGSDRASSEALGRGTIGSDLIAAPLAVLAVVTRALMLNLFRALTALWHLVRYVASTILPDKDRAPCRLHRSPRYISVGKDGQIFGLDRLQTVCYSFGRWMCTRSSRGLHSHCSWQHSLAFTRQCAPPRLVSRSR